MSAIKRFDCTFPHSWKPPIHVCDFLLRKFDTLSKKEMKMIKQQQQQKSQKKVHKYIK